MIRHLACRCFLPVIVCLVSGASAIIAASSLAQPTSLQPLAVLQSHDAFLEIGAEERGPPEDTVCAQFSAGKTCLKSNKQVSDPSTQHAFVDLCKAWPHLCHDSAHKRRCQLPQLPEHLAGSGWATDLQQANIPVESTTVTVSQAASFRPAQMEMNACKVCGMLRAARLCFQPSPSDPLMRRWEPSGDRCGLDGCFCVWKTPLAVAQDNYIIDGHHRWAALRLLAGSNSSPISRINFEMRIDRYGAGLEAVVALADQHPEDAPHVPCGSVL